MAIKCVRVGGGVRSKTLFRLFMVLFASPFLVSGLLMWVLADGCFVRKEKTEVNIK